MKSTGDAVGPLERLGFIGLGNMGAPSRCDFYGPATR